MKICVSYTINYRNFSGSISNAPAWHLEADGVLLSESEVCLRSQGNHPN